jgi:chromosome partitioning protein
MDGRAAVIVSFVNQKGGVGKTTAAINFASGLSRRNRLVLLLDVDPQGSVLQWRSIADNDDFDALHKPNPVSRSDIEAPARKYDYVVIDAPPAIGEITKSVLLFTNLAVVPIGPSALDIWSSGETVSLIRQVK